MECVRTTGAVPSSNPLERGEVEGEHDAVSTLDKLTAGAREQATELAVVGGPVAQDDVVAGALQE